MKSGMTLPRYYKNDLEYLEAWFGLIDLLLERKRLEEDDLLASSAEGPCVAEVNRKIRRYRHTLRKYTHAAYRQGISFALDRICRRYHLSRLEKEIILVLLYKHFSPECYITNGRSILNLLANNRREMMQYRHYLAPGNKLRRFKLLTCEQFEADRNILDIDFDLPDDLISELTGTNRHKTSRKKNSRKSYKNYIDLWFRLVQLLERQAELQSHLRTEYSGAFSALLGNSLECQQDQAHIKQDIAKVRQRIRHFGAHSKNYPLEQLARKHHLSEAEKLILVILLRESLGLAEPLTGCEGKKILAIISSSESEMIKNRALLYATAKLRSNNLIRQERSWMGQNILDSEYYLSERMIRCLLGHLSDNENLTDEELIEPDEDRLLIRLQPRYRLEDVIIAPEKREQIQIALSQEKYKQLIFEQWGFGTKIPYGRNLAILFAGPPGTGKTMMAEAVAAALGKKLLIANYAQIQNLYVGETEKRIVAAFKKAREAQAVLLWDEADAMFYSRDMACHSWEARDINIILQQIEQFPEVVILTTNRKDALDSALERRINLKVEFEMPGEAERLAIWRFHLPSQAPLAPDVDLVRLARDYAVSGGIIKNAVLIAARYAAARSQEQAPVCISMSDLRRAVEQEINSSWSGAGRSHLGFCPSRKSRRAALQPSSQDHH